MISDPLAVFAVLVAVVALATWLEERWAVARALGSVLLAIALAMLLSNVGVLPGTSPAYQALGDIGADVGIALILLGVDIRSVVRAGPRMLTAFALGAVGTVAGAVLGWVLLHGQIGGEAWKLAGQYTGTYIGGSVNMVAVGQSLGTSPQVFAAAIAADNVTTTVWMIACFAAPTLLRKWWGPETRGEGGPAPARPAGGAEATQAVNRFVTSVRRITIRDVTLVALVAVGSVWLSRVLGSRVPRIPSVLWLTTIVLVAAQMRPVRALSGAPVLGNYVLQLFLAAIGAQSVIAEIVKVGPAVFWFTLVVVGVHGLLLFGVGRLARLDLGTLAVASQANVGGPASAMALATARGYADRLLPGIAVGLLGYAVGNYAGFAVAALLRG